MPLTQMQNKETYKLRKEKSQTNKTVSSLVRTSLPKSASKQKQRKKTENSIILRQKILTVSPHQIVCEKKSKCCLVLIYLEPPGGLA